VDDARLIKKHARLDSMVAYAYAEAEGARGLYGSEQMQQGSAWLTTITLAG
jgi:hypothetical protein